MTELTPPRAAHHPITREFHGRSFVDDFEWLRDKESPETLEYLKAENAYTEAKTAHLETLTENIFQEVKSRIKETDMSVPSRRGDFWYYGRTEEGKNYAYSCRIPVEQGSDPWTPPVIPEEGRPEGERVLLDANLLAEGHEFFSLGASVVSDSGNLLAYSVDYAGDERFELFIKDLRTGELLEDHLEGIFYGATWVGDEYIFYSTVDESWRPDTVWRHKVGTAQSEDVVVMREEDPRFSIGAGKTRSEKFLVIVASSKLTSEFWVLEQSNPEGEFRCLWQRESGVEYDVDHAVVGGQDYWLVTHNVTGPNYELGYCPLGGTSSLPSLRELTVLMPHEDTVRLEGVDCYRDQIVVGYRRGHHGRALRLGRVHRAGLRRGALHRGRGRQPGVGRPGAAGELHLLPAAGAAL